MKSLWLLLAGSVLLNVYLLGNRTPEGQLVTKVLDGDTFVTEDKNIVRFDSLNAPEIAFCGGEQAKKELEKLILGKRVKIDAQVRDVNGRTVATVHRGNVWVDEELIKTGWVTYGSTTIPNHEKLKAIDDQNQLDKKGVYGEQCSQYQNIDDPKCNIKGNIVGEWTNKGEKIYHMQNCAQYKTVIVEKYRGEEWFCTEKEARAAGYRKSTRCF